MRSLEEIAKDYWNVSRLVRVHQRTSDEMRGKIETLSNEAVRFPALYRRLHQLNKLGEGKAIA